MCKIKSIARREHMVAASSSSSENDLSLGADKKETPAPNHYAAFSSAVPQRRGGVPSQRGQFTRKYKTHLFRFWFWFWFFFTYNIICEQLINILFIFRFTNIEAVRVITSAFKSLMKILLFQQSQVSRYPNWRPYIDA